MGIATASVKTCSATNTNGAMAKLNTMGTCTPNWAMLVVCSSSRSSSLVATAVAIR